VNVLLTLEEKGVYSSYTRDDSNTWGANYSSTEVWFTVRKDF